MQANPDAKYEILGNGTTQIDVVPVKRHRSSIRAKSPQISQVHEKSFNAIRDECLEMGKLFEDPEFPAGDTALCCHEKLCKSKRPEEIQWKRPKEIIDNPRLFVDGASRFDVKQGTLGDCWLLAAIASLSLNKKLLRRIIPRDQEFDKDYAGVFHFQFWQYGEWVDVVIDDLLPTVNNQLVYLHSAQTNEFWSALLEKAYAKLSGSYEALKGGRTTEAMVDFTGGICELYELKNDPLKNLFNIMDNSCQRNSLMCCGIESKNPAKQPSNGLRVKHAYSVTRVEKVTTKKNELVQLVRVRNPWGKKEFTGDWCDGSNKWKTLSEKERTRLEVQDKDDGEFWMSFHDFCNNFTVLEICHLGPDAVDEHRPGQWVATRHEGRWVRGSNAGGCKDRPSKEEDDDKLGCSFIVSLMQKNMREKKAKEHQCGGLLKINFEIYKMSNFSVYEKIRSFFRSEHPIKESQRLQHRDVSQRFKLPAGEYVIVPSTFEPNEEAEFLLRLYTKKPIKLDCRKTDYVRKMQDVGGENLEENYANFKAIFDQHKGENGEIDALQLQGILNAIIKEKCENSNKTNGCSLEACRSMIALMDVTDFGYLNFDEFKELYSRLGQWTTVFKTFNENKSGELDLYELREALKSTGYTLNSQLYQKLCIRYASKDLKISMDDFVLLSVRLEAMFAAFERFKDSGTLSLDDWLMTTMYS